MVRITHHYGQGLPAIDLTRIVKSNMRRTYSEHLDAVRVAATTRVTHMNVTRNSKTFPTHRARVLYNLESTKWVTIGVTVFNLAFFGQCLSAEQPYTIITTTHAMKNLLVGTFKTDGVNAINSPFEKKAVGSDRLEDCLAGLER